jgi:6-phosphogluconolactonase
MGAQGTPGANGAVGPAGSQGAAGPAGATGATGPAGAMGSAGATGAQGPAGTIPDAGAPVTPNAVYTLSNDPTANEVVAYARAADGSLTPFGSFPTGGTGSGGALGDQGALLFDAAHSAFFAVNAADNSISMLGLRADGTLALYSKVASGGISPISLTLSGSVLYVLNAGDATHPAQISGFRVDAGGLLGIAASTQLLSAAQPGAAQIQFSPDGSTLVVTEKGTNVIDTYKVVAGVASAPATFAASGTTPYGFAFSASGQLVVSEAFGGGDGLGATSSYSLAVDGTVTPVSKSLKSTQSAPCWVAVAGSDAYVTNTKSNTITAYAVAADGTLSLVHATGVDATTGMAPSDIAITPGKDFLYTRNGGSHSLSVFAIGSDGALTKKADFVGIPLGAVGLAAR